jgi:hypothetical protein
LARDGGRNDPFEAAMRGALARARDAGGQDCPEPAVLAAYYEGALDTNERARWQRHCADCARCQRAIAAFARIADAVEAVPNSALSMDDRLRQSAGERLRWWNWRTPVQLAGIAAAGAIAIVIVMRTVSVNRGPASNGAGAAPASNAQVALNEMKALSASPEAGAPSRALQDEATHPAPRPQSDRDFRQDERSKNQPENNELEKEEARRSEARAAAKRERMSASATSPTPRIERRKAIVSDLAANRPSPAGPAPAPAEAPAAALPPLPSPAPPGAIGSGAALGANTSALMRQSPVPATGYAGAPSTTTGPGAAAVGGDAGLSQMAQNRAAIVNALPGANATIVEPPGASVVWMIGNRGALSRYSAGGGWVPQTSGVSADLTAGSAPSATTCWIVGHGGTIIRTIDGEHWTKVSAPTDRDLVAIVARNANAATIFAAGTRWTTADGGATWRQP